MTTKEQCVSEQIKPDSDGFNAMCLVGGAPSMPRAFRWRGEEFVVAEVVDVWKETGPCTHGSAEQYVRKHWFHVRTTSGDEMKIYFERQARSAKQRKTRWWLYTITHSDDNPGEV